MATAKEQIDYMVELLEPFGRIRSRKMFGDYMIYLDDKPIFLVCDGVVYVKQLEEIKEWMKKEPSGIPYPGAKIHYQLDLENQELCRNVIPILLEQTPFPKAKNRKKEY